MEPLFRAPGSQPRAPSSQLLRGSMAISAPSGRAAVPTVPDRRRPGKNTLPDQRTLLSWLFVGRLVLAIGRPARRRAGLDRAPAGIVPRQRRGGGRPDVHRVRGVERSFCCRRKPGNAFFLIQALVDLGVVTTIVHFAGQPQSAFPALYVLVVAAYALLMPPAWGALTAVLASAAVPGRRVLDPRRRTRHGVLGADGACSTWCSRSWRCWDTGCARRGWSRRRSPPSSSGSGSRRTTSCGTSARACSRWTGSAGWPSSIRRPSGCSTSTARR